MAAKKAKNNGVVEKKLISIADTVITAAQRSQDPTLNIPVRSLANVNFNPKRGIIEIGRRKQERTFFNVGMAKKIHADGAGGRRLGRTAARQLDHLAA